MVNFLERIIDVLTLQDWNGILRGSEAFAKPTRPKSFDPEMLLDEPRSPRSAYSKSTVRMPCVLLELHDL